MEEILFIISISILAIWIFISNMKIKKEIRDLKSEMISNEKLISKKVEELKNEVSNRSGSILEESKAHLDAALMAISKRIGKRKNPTEGKD